MKDIMAKESSTEDEGVPSFMYSPADASMPLLFSLAQPLSKLRQDLLRVFAGRELCLDDIYRQHSVDTGYIKKNYREILMILEDERVIVVRSTKGNMPLLKSEWVVVDLAAGFQSPGDFLEARKGGRDKPLSRPKPPEAGAERPAFTGACHVTTIGLPWSLGRLRRHHDWLIPHGEPPTRNSKEPEIRS